MTPPFLPHDFPNTVGTVVASHATGGESLPPVGNLPGAPQSGTAMGIPVGDCVPHMMSNRTVGEEGCRWVPNCKDDNTRDHLLRPPAA